MNDEAGAAAGGGSPAVLVVEDDGATGLLLREWLSAAGHRCLVAATAEAGWRVLREEESVWLVLVDVKMPGTYDGIDLLDCIAQMAHGSRRLQVVMMSSNEYNIACAAAHGCDEFITKPFSRATLLAKIAAMQTKQQQ